MIRIKGFDELGRFIGKFKEAFWFLVGVASNAIDFSLPRSHMSTNGSSLYSMTILRTDSNMFF
jgi:hypothetical protein